LDNLYKHLQEGWAINKERINLFAIPLSLKRLRGSSSTQALSIDINGSSSQSREIVPSSWEKIA
jgi:hypothetical protein